MMKQPSGFTLIELMIAVAVLGILAAIALPAYNDYVRRSKTTEATSTLADLRVKMEQYYLDNRNYGAGACGVTMPTIKYFTYACALSGGGQAYTITASGAAAEGMTGYTYTINESNAKTSTVPGVSGTQGCWITKKGDSC